MENIALNDSGAIYRDAVGMDGALDVAADRQFLCADLALYLCPFGDHDGRGAYFSLDVTKNSQGPIAHNLADDRKARTNRGGGLRLQRITITRQCRPPEPRTNLQLSIVVRFRPSRKVSLPSGSIIHSRYNATLPSVLVVENFLLVASGASD